MAQLLTIISPTHGQSTLTMVTLICIRIILVQRKLQSRWRHCECYSEVANNPFNSLYPRSTEGGMGVYWIHPDVCPSVCRQGFRNFLKKLSTQFISYLAFTLMGWVSSPKYIFVILASFPALWWPNIWTKMGFLELFEKTIGSIHFIPGIYPYGVSLLTPLHFCVPSLVFGPLVAKYLAENGVSRIFLK